MYKVLFKNGLSTKAQFSHNRGTKISLHFSRNPFSDIHYVEISNCWWLVEKQLDRLVPLLISNK